MSNSNDSNIKEGLYYLFLAIVFILGFLFAAVNFGSFIGIYNHNYDWSWGFYDFLWQGKQAFYYSIIWFVELTLLLLFICYFAFTRKRKKVFILCCLVLFSIFASILIYKIMTDFREA